MQPLPEIERHLAVPELAVRRQYVEQQLEARVAQRRGGMQEGFAADHEEAGQRIGDVAAEHEGAEPVAELRQADAERTERRGIDALVELACGADDLGLAGADRRDHALDGLGIVLAVAIHDAEQVALGRQHALDACLGEAAIGDPQHQPHAVVGARHGAHDVCGAVGRIVVDEQDFPVETGECCLGPLHERSDVPGFVIGGNDDRDVRTGHCEPSEILCRPRQYRLPARLSIGQRGFAGAFASARPNKKPAGSRRRASLEENGRAALRRRARPSARPSRSPAIRRRRGW